MDRHSVMLIRATQISLFRKSKFDKSLNGRPAAIFCIFSHYMILKWHLGKDFAMNQPFVYVT